MKNFINYPQHTFTKFDATNLEHKYRVNSEFIELSKVYDIYHSNFNNLRVIDLGNGFGLKVYLDSKDKFCFENPSYKYLSLEQFYLDYDFVTPKKFVLKTFSKIIGYYTEKTNRILGIYETFMSDIEDELNKDIAEGFAITRDNGSIKATKYGLIYKQRKSYSSIVSKDGVSKVCRYNSVSGYDLTNHESFLKAFGSGMQISINDLNEILLPKELGSLQYTAVKEILTTHNFIDSKALAKFGLSINENEMVTFDEVYYRGKKFAGRTYMLYYAFTEIDLFDIMVSLLHELCKEITETNKGLI